MLYIHVSFAYCIKALAGLEKSEKQIIEKSQFLAGIV